MRDLWDELKRINSVLAKWKFTRPFTFLNGCWETLTHLEPFAPIQWFSRIFSDFIFFVMMIWTTEREPNTRWTINKDFTVISVDSMLSGMRNSRSREDSRLNFARFGWRENIIETWEMPSHKSRENFQIFIGRIDDFYLPIFSLTIFVDFSFLYEIYFTETRTEIAKLDVNMFYVWLRNYEWSRKAYSTRFYTHRRATSSAACREPNER